MCVLVPLLLLLVIAPGWCSNSPLPAGRIRREFEARGSDSAGGRWRNRGGGAARLSRSRLVFRRPGFVRSAGGSGEPRARRRGERVLAAGGAGWLGKGAERSGRAGWDSAVLIAPCLRARTSFPFFFFFCFPICTVTGVHGTPCNPCRIARACGCARCGKIGARYEWTHSSM